MGFPVAYRVDLFPKFFMHILYLLGSITSFISTLSKLMMAPSYFLEQEYPTRMIIKPSIPAALIRELLPVIKFKAVDSGGGPPESCAVCLCEFVGEEEIRCLQNCRHFFHRGCLDRWMDHDQMTCPLCRTRLLPRHLQEEFNRRLGDAFDHVADHDNYVERITTDFGV